MEIDPCNIKMLESFCYKVEFYPSPPKKVCLPMLARLLRSLFSLEPYTIWRHYSKSFLERVDHLIQSDVFDIVHCDILPIVYSIRNKKCVFRSLTDHDVSYLKCFRMASKSSNFFMKIFCYFESYKLKMLESKVINEVELTVVVSEVDKKILQRLCPGARFEIIENGVDVDKFLPSFSQSEPKNLLWIGGFNHNPNKQGIYWFLEEIYPLIKILVPTIKLVLIGGGVTNKLKRFASADSSIKILGFVDDPIPYLQRATVFVAPILSGGGTRLKLLEAMAAGKAIVTTSIGAEGIEGENNIHFLLADSNKEFANSTVRLLENETLRILLGKNAREKAMLKYDWKKICNKLNQIYRNYVSSD